ASANSSEGGNPAPNPIFGQSIERKSNGYDSNNNFADFIIKEIPTPQNSSNILNNSEQDNSDQNDAANTTDNSSQNGSSQETGANSGSSAQNSSAQEGGSGNTDNNYVSKIIITEFLPDPEDSDKDNEFIEIYNNDSIEADLAGWTLEDKIGKIKKFVIPEKTVVKAGKYKVFYSDETGIALNNSGDGVILRNKNGNIISETLASDSAKEEQSYALDKNGKWAWTLRPTPGRENIIELEEKIVSLKEITKAGSNSDGVAQKNSAVIQSEADNEQEYDFSDTIIISEIFPNPPGKDNQEENYEWIELHNTSDKDVNLKGWRIDDVLNKGSKQHIIKEDSVIKAWGYKTFSYNETKIMLNNSGDEVNIIWPDGEIIDSAQYEKTVEGQSYSLTSGENWIWTAEITPKKENKTEAVLIEEDIMENDFEYVYVEDEDNLESEIINPDFIEADIEDLWHFEKHTRVKVAGIVSAPPGIFADNVFYLNGIQIFSYEIKLPKIELGDEAEIIGKISEVGGEERILLEDKKDLKILSRNNLIEPKLISTGDVNESAEGLLAIVEGKVSQIKNEVFYLDDGSGQVKIYIKPQTGIEKPEIKIGDWMVITGQASQTSSGYRILPRFSQDIKLSRVSGVSTAKASSMPNESENGNVNDNNNSNNNSGKNSLLELLFFIIAAIVLIDWIRMKKLKTKN
ncbi:lamin tail domain-containing protein, partial [Patescibacteria group bacterium]|nr:lamin tail domain-containing protein [Patescibacteria group bacterium]